jgi:magnesium transporter
VKEHWTFENVLDHVRMYGKDSETLNAVYVTDERGHLIDDIPIREVLLAPLNSRIRDLMDRKFVSLNVSLAQQEAVDVFRRYDHCPLSMRTVRW